jgi:hypothetical protein
MQAYPEIYYYGDYWGLPIIAFNKLDGSNLRFEFSQKRGFYKFGTRNVLFNRQHDQFGFAIDLFLNKYNEPLSSIFKSKTYRNILSLVCFAELYSDTSEFGQHDFKNGIFNITLFDVDQYKKGFVHPKQFIKDFSKVGIPEIIYEGNLNREFVNNVKTNKFKLKEGVVDKGLIPNKKENNLYYCKIKTNDWFDRLRNKNIDLYNREIRELRDTSD